MTVAGSGALDPDLRDAYLARLGLEAEPPSAAALAALHRRHAERVPYETLWIHGGEAWDVDPVQAAVRIARQHRGGYCFHLNGALALLLRSLGYRVHRHVGAVHGVSGPDPALAGNHLVLSVDALPTADHPEGTWYVDVGLGDLLHEPMPLRAGAMQQGPYRLELVALADGWALRHDRDGGVPGVTWAAAETEADEPFRDQHHRLSTDPDSGFVRIGVATTRDAHGVDAVRGLVRTRTGSDPMHEEITDRDAWFAALEELFGLRFDASPPGTADRLWRRTLDRHRAWVAAGRP